MDFVLEPTSDTLKHSAKGSVWKKHKYVKKSNGRYYYADDIARQRKRISANHKLNESVKKAEGDWESGKYFVKSGSGSSGSKIPYFNADNPGSMVGYNIQAVERGEWDNSTNEDMRNAVRQYNELKKLRNEQDRADANRSKVEEAIKNTANTISSAVNKVKNTVIGSGKDDPNKIHISDDDSTLTVTFKNPKEVNTNKKKKASPADTIYRAIDKVRDVIIPYKEDDDPETTQISKDDSSLKIRWKKAK